MKKKKRNLALSLVIVGVVAVGLLGWGYVQPAGAHPGYSCNPSAGHGNPGCHVAVTPPTTKAPAPPTTKAPAPPTTKATSPKTTLTTASATGTAPTTTIAGLTTTSGASTTTGTTVLGETTTTLAPTTAILGETTTTTNPIAAMAGGGGSGLTGGWIAVMLGLGLIAFVGWTGMAVMWRGRRASADSRASARHAASASGPVRFVLAERLAHWTYAFCFLVAGISGALMWIPSTRQWMAGARFTVINYHGYVGLAMVIVPLSIFFILDPRRLGETRRALDQWDGNDRRWLRAALTGRMLRGGKMPPQGRFNAGQKVNSHLVAGLAVGFIVTGSLLLFRLHLPFWLVAGLLFCHKVLAVTGGVLLVGHLGIALLTRHGRGGLRAMVKGRLPTHIAREGHAIWYAEWLKRQPRA